MVLACDEHLPTAAVAAAMSAAEVQGWMARGAALGGDGVARLTLRDARSGRPTMRSP